MSPAPGVTSGAAFSDWVISPRDEPRRLTPSMLASPVAAPGIRPVETQTMPCCAASTEKYSRVDSLSPDRLRELVKPAAILSFQPWVNQTLELASANTLNGADGPPM